MAVAAGISFCAVIISFSRKNYILAQSK